MNGHQTPESRPEQYVGVRITPQEKANLLAIAEREGRTLSQLCRRALQQFLKRRKTESA